MCAVITLCILIKLMKTHWGGDAENAGLERRDWKTRDNMARGGKRGTGKRGTLKVWKALQFSKAKATEQRSRQCTAAWTHPQTRTATIRLMILTPAQTPSSRPSLPQPLTTTTSCEVCLVHTVIRVSRLCYVATSGSVNRAQTKWNVRVVVVPSAAQTFRWSCVCFGFYVTLCTVISDFLHWTTWSFSDMLCRTCYYEFCVRR